MKKISLFLATVMFFLAVATIPGSLQEVQAYQESDLNWSEYEVNHSAKAGASLGMFFHLSSKPDSVEGYKAVLALKGSDNTETEVAAWNVSEDDIRVVESFGYTNVYLDKNVTLEKDIPEGEYTAYLYDANGEKIDTDSYSGKFVNKAVLYYSFFRMSDDNDYIYAYVYDYQMPTGFSINENTYPIIYENNTQTPVTAFDAFTTIKNETEGEWYGRQVDVYRLKITSKDKMVPNGEWMDYNISNSEILPSITNSKGTSFAFMYDSSSCQEWFESLPFDKNNTPSEDPKPDNGNQNPDDTKQDGNTQPDNTPSTPDNTNQNTGSNTGSNTTTTTVQPEYVVSALTGSSVPEVQASIDRLSQLVGEIQTNPSDLRNTLKAYAPDVAFSKVTDGEAVDISEKNGVDISGGVQVTFTDAKIAASVTGKDTVIVLHVKHDGTIERVPATAGDGTITAAFTSLSPVAWFKVSGAENTRAVSPKTGEHFFSFLFH